MSELITVNRRDGSVCCASDNPNHLCRKCRRAYEGDQTMPGMTRNQYERFRAKQVANCECQHDPADDLLVAPTLNYGGADPNTAGCRRQPVANVSGSFAGTGSHAIQASHGGVLRTAADTRSIPGFELPPMLDDGDTGRYPTSGVKPSKVLTSGRPRVTPKAAGTFGMKGGDVGSYPVTGVNDGQGSTDSAGDDYEDPSARAGRSGSAGSYVGQRSDRGGPVRGAVPQYDAFDIRVDDRGDEQRGTIHRGGQSVYTADWLGGRQSLPGDYDGVRPGMSPTQSADERKRVFGSQPTVNICGVAVPTTGEQDVLMAPPTIDYAALSAAWPKQGRRESPYR
jgi:hypothetical protein